MGLLAGKPTGKPKLAWQLIKGFAESFASIIMTVCKRAFGFIIETIITIASDIKSAIAEVFNVLESIFSTIGPVLARSLVDAIDHAVTAIKDAILSIKSLISDVVPDFVKKVFQQQSIMLAI